MFCGVVECLGCVLITSWLIVRCDSGEMPGNRCSNCIQYGLECTHKEVTKVIDFPRIFGRVLLTRFVDVRFCKGVSASWSPLVACKC